MSRPEWTGSPDLDPAELATLPRADGPWWPRLRPDMWTYYEKPGPEDWT